MTTTGGEPQEWIACCNCGEHSTDSPSALLPPPSSFTLTARPHINANGNNKCITRDAENNFWMRMSADDAAALADSVENNHPHRTLMIVKTQRWFRQICNLKSEIDNSK